MTYFYLLLAVAAILAGVRLRSRAGEPRPPALDDTAIRRIIEEGRFAADAEEDEPLDLDAAAREEEEFWDESWDAPEEFRP